MDDTEPTYLTIVTPLYWLTAHLACNMCGRDNAVGALATRQVVDDALNGEEPEFTDEDGFLLSYLTRMPEELLAAIVVRMPGYQLTYGQIMGEDYFMSTCPCGGHYGDYYIHKRLLDLAFRSPASIHVEKLEITTPISLQCGYSFSDSIGSLLDRR